MTNTETQRDKGEGAGKIIPKHPHESWIPSAEWGV
jgi:hypothetical protein